MLNTHIVRVTGSPLPSVQARPWVLQWSTGDGGVHLQYYASEAEAEGAELALYRMARPQTAEGRATAGRHV